MTHKVAFWLLVAFNIVDAVMTALILTGGGGEFNPIMQWWIDQFGLMGLVYGKIPAMVLLAYIVFVMWKDLPQRTQVWCERGLVAIVCAFAILTVYSSVGLYIIA